MNYDRLIGLRVLVEIDDQELKGIVLGVRKSKLVAEGGAVILVQSDVAGALIEIPINDRVGIFIKDPQ